jgi:hypothetical protein
MAGSLFVASRAAEAVVLMNLSLGFEYSNEQAYWLGDSAGYSHPSVMGEELLLKDVEDNTGHCLSILVVRWPSLWARMAENGRYEVKSRPNWYGCAGSNDKQFAAARQRS